MQSISTVKGENFLNTIKFFVFITILVGSFFKYILVSVKTVVNMEKDFKTLEKILGGK